MNGQHTAKKRSKHFKNQINSMSDKPLIYMKRSGGMDFLCSKPNMKAFEFITTFNKSRTTEGR